ncbi:MAG: LysR family transcriptional regulator [Alphaproteobacteria bacterium]|nr:LysR family transcriptional regulator [Alphaproteobacteria bacterium]
MEMHQVRYFLAVCRTLNFTKAAEECNVAQPSLTRAIQKLEEEFGGLLFHRERANTHLTDLGRAMQPHLERTYDAAQTAKQLATSYKKGDVVHLRLGVSATVPSDTVTSVLGGVRQSMPGFELTLDGGADTKLLDGAVAGDLDLILVGDDHELPERVRSWTLHREPLLAVMTKTHKLAGQASVAIGDLDGVEMIQLSNCPIAARIRQMCLDAGVKPVFNVRVANCEQIVALIREGLGIATLPQTLAAGSGLVALPIEGLNIERAITLGTVAGRRFSPASDAFIKLARTRDWGKA